jgi:hypothetical protein
VDDLLQQLDGNIRGAAFGPNLLSICDSLTDIQRNTSVLIEAFDTDLKGMASQLEMVVEKVKRLGKKFQSD